MLNRITSLPLQTLRVWSTPTRSLTIGSSSRSSTTQPRTANYVESFRTCCPTEDSMWNWTMSVADGESRRMACPRRASSHQSCSTFTLMTNQSTMERVTSYTQMIYVSHPSTLHSQWVLICTTMYIGYWTLNKYYYYYYSFTEVETTPGDALDELTQYYRSNSLRANPDKTQVTAFHLRNKEANRSLKVDWNRTELENTPTRST